MAALQLPGAPVAGAAIPPKAGPIRGLQQAMAAAQPPDSTAAATPAGPDRSLLGQRLPAEPFQALMDVVRRFGKVY